MDSTNSLSGKLQAPTLEEAFRIFVRNQQSGAMNQYAAEPTGDTGASSGDAAKDADVSA